MENNITTINVNTRKIKVLKMGSEDYISLTDLARYADKDEPRLSIRDRMRNKDVISYLGLWEKMKLGVIHLECHHKNG